MCVGFENAAIVRFWETASAMTETRYDIASGLADDFLRIYYNPRNFHYRTGARPELHILFTERAIGSGLVLADLLEEKGYGKLSGKLSTLIRHLRRQDDWLSGEEAEVRRLFARVYQQLVSALWRMAGKTRRG